MGAAHAASDVLWKGPVVDVRGARDAEKLAQNSWVRIEALGETRIAQTRQVLDFPILGQQVEERGLDQGQRAHIRRSSRGGDECPKCAVRVRDDVRAAIEQRSQVSSVNLEISSPLGAGRIAAPVSRD
jgi:hypothetical protein